MDTTVARSTRAEDECALLRIRLLGEVGAALDGQAVPSLTTPRMQRLLARVALARGAGVPRDQLAGELWPDSGATQGRTNLRKLLHELRRAVPGVELVDTRGPTVRWCAEEPAWVDVAAFVDAAAHGDLEVAADSYRGDLLPGVDDDWVVGERERLRRVAVEVRAGLAAAADAGSRDDEVVEHARHLLRLDPLHEPAARLVMRALARRGERSEALRTYDRLAAGLERDLGVAPEPATTAVAEELRFAGRVGSPEPLLVGRRTELRAALTTWEEVTGGGARLLCVTGEAGIGKSRLVEEVARQAAADGHAVAYGRGYRAAGRSPWGPVIDWLRSEPVRTCLPTVDDACLVELARLLPELGARGVAPPSARSSTAVGRRHRLLHAVVRGLLAVRRPLLLVVDDLQWCDGDTVELCGFLVESVPSAPVLIAGTVRDEEIGHGHPVARLRGQLAQGGAVSELPIGPLDRAATAEMARLVAHRALPSDVAAQLWTETEGNPLFIVEAVRAGFGTRTTGPVTLTPTVHAVIGARLDRLSPGGRGLAEVAATIGREFTVPVLAAAAGRTEDDLTDDLDELWRRHIVRVRGGTFDFSHDRLRDVALESISPTRRRVLHHRVAEAIEALHRDDLGPVSARLAVHLAAAGLDSRAVEAYERAARHAYQVFALDAGIALVQRALRLLEDSPRGDARDEIELRLLATIGVPLVARRGYGAAEVRRCYERALTLHRRLGRRPSSPVLRGLALHAVATCRFDRAEELGHELVAAGADDHAARVEGEYVLGVTGFWRGEFAAAERHLTTAIDRYRVEDAPLHVERYAQDPLGVCLCRLALTQLFRGRPADADRTMREAVRLATELDHPMTVGYVRAYDAVLATFEPDDRRLDATVTALDTVTSTMRLGYFTIVAELLSGWRDVCTGDLRGVAAMRRATQRMQREQPLHLTFGASLLARGHGRAGEPAAGRAVVAAGLAATERSSQRYLLPELLRVDAELLARTGDRAGAAGTAGRAVDAAVALASPWLADRALATLAALAPDR